MKKKLSQTRIFFLNAISFVSWNISDFFPSILNRVIAIKGSTYILLIFYKVFQVRNKTFFELQVLNFKFVFNIKLVASLLLANGANPTAQFQGKTALSLAEEQGHTALAALLRRGVHNKQ